jgi:hypothetical protein
MPITATYDHSHRRVTARAEGTVTLEEIRDHLEEERQEPGLAYAELIDARLSVPAFSSADVRVLVALLRWLGEKTRLGPTAVVVADEFQFGMVRMTEILVEDVCQIRPFYNDVDAERWLKQLERR